MKTELIFPIIIITLDFCASIIYYYKRDMISGTYWLSATILTICVTIK